MLVNIANLSLPDEWKRRTDEHDARFFRLLREKTQHWPELWAPAKKDESPSKTEERVLGSVRKIRKYLRLFWTETDPRARDWYIHRARQHYQRHFVVRESQETREKFSKASTADEARDWAGWLNIEIEQLLDRPPQRNSVEDALFELQELARYPSKSPLYCKNPDCEKPYFLSRRKGQKYCTDECSQAGILLS